MRLAFALSLFFAALTVVPAHAATLIGEQIEIRLDLEGGERRTVTVGDGPEFIGSARRESRPWTWTVDFTSTGFQIEAVLTEAVEFFDPHIAFRSVTPGLIPLDLAAISFTEKVAVNLGDRDRPWDDKFDEYLSLDGINLRFLGFYKEPGQTFQVGSSVRWRGTIALDPSVHVPPSIIPLPAAGWLLLAALGALGAAGVGRRV